GGGGGGGGRGGAGGWGGGVRAGGAGGAGGGPGPPLRRGGDRRAGDRRQVTREHTWPEPAGAPADRPRAPRPAAAGGLPGWPGGGDARGRACCAVAGICWPGSRG